MKAKIISIATFIILAYLLPLSGNTNLIPSFQVGILVVFVIVIFATQPPLSTTDVKAVILILLSYLISQSSTIIEWAYYTNFRNWVWDWQTITGLILMVGGTSLRTWCIWILGEFFTTAVKTQEKQIIITTGAYSIVRHPSYLGTFLAAIGTSVFMHAWVAVVITTVVLFIVYYFRIRAEEEALVNEFGNEYRVYSTKTKKLIPYIY
jgi:protein-S-isoprenylcysteine O-methyltransferase Ste14